MVSVPRLGRIPPRKLDDYRMIQIDMDMPKCCMECRFNSGSGCSAKSTGLKDRINWLLTYPDSDDDHEIYEQRMPWCPLVEVNTEDDSECADCDMAENSQEQITEAGRL